MEMQKKEKVFKLDKNELQKTYDTYKETENQKEMETKALLSQTLQSLEKYKGMDNMKEEQYNESSIAEKKQSEKLEVDQATIKSLDTQLAESMKRSQAFIQHQNKVIEKAALKEAGLLKRQDLLIKTAKREAEDKILDAENNFKEMRKKAIESDEKSVELKRELSGMRQAWGISNSTKEKEIRMIKKADELRLQQ